ncbi:hypothetical protein TRFO_10741 [Tritrichomonas foetus]|uniref:Uncharacterized protein n=1 Tax=Tritrichomonas foetus TaxID=1144522 RepID=A0A1J4JC91_9EUKA|nr:hypothetical protein TRFO_10741 [Tritrichomonas foetus]|eukprot:OHS95029.1 hypothetical protein TRFO_10741 [Tritrichomonas foetus]
MKTRTPLKENRNDNQLSETPKLKNISSPCNSISTPTDKKNSKSKSTIKKEMKNIEKEIEARLRLQLRVEYSQRYHQLQDQYDQEIMSSSINMSSSFFENYSMFSTSQNYSVDSFDIHNRNQKIENEIQEQKHRHKILLDEQQKNLQLLEKAKEELSNLLSIQEQLQDEQRFLSTQIGEAYSRHSDLRIELATLREQREEGQLDKNENIKDFSFSTPTSMKNQNENDELMKDICIENQINNREINNARKCSLRSTPKRLSSKFNIINLDQDDDYSDNDDNNNLQNDTKVLNSNQKIVYPPKF